MRTCDTWKMSSTFAKCFVYALLCYLFACTCTIKSPPGGASMKIHCSKVFLHGLGGEHRPHSHHVVPQRAYRKLYHPNVCLHGLSGLHQPHLHFPRCVPLTDGLNIQQKPSSNDLFFHAKILRVSLSGTHLGKCKCGWCKPLDP